SKVLMTDSNSESSWVDLLKVVHRVSVTGVCDALGLTVGGGDELLEPPAVHAAAIRPMEASAATNTCGLLIESLLTLVWPLGLVRSGFGPGCERPQRSAGRPVSVVEIVGTWRAGRTPRAFRPRARWRWLHATPRRPRAPTRAREA